MTVLRKLVYWTLLLLGFAALFVLVPSVAHAQATSQKSDSAESWQQEFDEVCSKTQDAMSLAESELKSLVQRCDALEPRIEKLDETRRKVYLRRLRQCRGLYAYVLESKNVDPRNSESKNADPKPKSK